MAFQFSHEFHRNWLAASKTERNRIKHDLKAIVDLLKPSTELASWQKKHGIYEKNTTAAEQVGLFDDAVNDAPIPDYTLEEQTTNDATTPNQSTNRQLFGSADERASNHQKPTSESTSNFLTQVTQGLNNSPEGVESNQASSLSHQDIANIAQTVTAGLEVHLQTMIEAAVEKSVSKQIRSTTLQLKKDITDEVVKSLQKNLHNSS